MLIEPRVNMESADGVGVGVGVPPAATAAAAVPVRHISKSGVPNSDMCHQHEIIHIHLQST